MSEETRIPDWHKENDLCVHPGGYHYPLTRRIEPMNVCGCSPKPSHRCLWCDNHLLVTFFVGMVAGGIIVAVGIVANVIWIINLR